MRSIIYLCVAIFISCSGSGQQSKELVNDGKITISGEVRYPSNGIIKLEKFQNNQANEIGRITLDENNKFEHELPIEEPGYYRLDFYGKQQVVMILDDDDVNVSVDGNSRAGQAKITGSSDHQIIEEIQAKKQSLQQSDEFKKLNDEFNKARAANDEERISELQFQYQEMDRENNEEIARMIKNYEPSLAILELLRSKVIDADQHMDVYVHVAEEMKEEYPNLEYTASFNETVESMKMLAIGNEAPEIEMPNPDGELVKLSSLRGNYVLVDFWAKWCKPCRQENPNIVKMYKKYNDQGFEVFGVSLDRNRADWLQAIEQDNLTWTHVSDLKFWQSEAAKTYNVTAIPFALLLDPDGKIIGKNLRGKALENKLEEIFD